MKLSLINGEEVLVEVPLAQDNWERYNLVQELNQHRGMNPKSIREHAMRLNRCILLAFPKRGRYRLNWREGLRFMVLNLAFRWILHYLMEVQIEVYEVRLRGCIEDITGSLYIGAQ